MQGCFEVIYGLGLQFRVQVSGCVCVCTSVICRCVHVCICFHIYVCTCLLIWDMGSSACSDLFIGILQLFLTSSSPIASVQGSNLSGVTNCQNPLVCRAGRLSILWARVETRTLVARRSSTTI